MVDGKQGWRVLSILSTRQEDNPTPASFDPAFLDAENEDGAGLDHGPSFSIVEATCDAQNDTLASSM